MKPKPPLIPVFAVIPVVVLLGLTAASPVPQEGSKAFAIVKGKQVYVEIGSVIGQGILQNESCTLTEPIAVGADVFHGNEGISIT
jgi:hypothetical protein